jgi:hypothetical protein
MMQMFQGYKTEDADGLRAERRRHASMQPSYTHTPVSRANVDAKHGTGRGGSNSAGKKKIRRIY